MQDNYLTVIVLIFIAMILTFGKQAAAILLLLTLAFPLSSSAQTGEIKFMQNSWNDALKQAAKQRKYIFVDAYATWCGPCKMLQRTTFKDKTAAAFFNKNFINLAMDMEKGQGPKLGSAWGLRAYPTLLVFNHKGERILYSEGYIGAADLLRFGKAALVR